MAGADFTVQIKGLSELKRALEQLPREIRGKVLGAAVKSGADLVRDAARVLVAKKLRRVERSIVAYRDRRSTDEDCIYNVGVTKQKKWPSGWVQTGVATRLFRRRYRYRGKIGEYGVTGRVENVMWPAFWWRFLEFGTRKMSARPFLRPALGMMQMAVISKIQERLQAGIEKAVAKLRWR